MFSTIRFQQRETKRKFIALIAEKFYKTNTHMKLHKIKLTIVILATGHCILEVIKAVINLFTRGGE